jgi:hypothetical protein
MRLEERPEKAFAEDLMAELSSDGLRPPWLKENGSMNEQPPRGEVWRPGGKEQGT